MKPLIKFGGNIRNTQIKDILPCNISEMVMKTIPISKTITNGCTVKKSTPFRIERTVSDTEPQR